MTVRVGVIGTGVMGAHHVRNLAGQIAGATLAAVSDLDLDRARDLVADLDGVTVYEDPLSLIGDAGVDAVLVASFDPTHEEYVLACLAAGKPVLCEKPLAPTRAGCENIVNAELSRGSRLVSVGFMRRYDEGYRSLRETLHSGQLGSALLLHSVHRNTSAPPGLPSEMLVTGSAVHEIDITRWLLDEEITWVSGHPPRRSPRVTGDTQDPQFLVLETSSGVVADVEVFVNAHYGYDVRCELVGDLGAAALAAPVRTLIRRDGAAAQPIPRDWLDHFAEAYRREVQDWVRHAARGAASGATAWDGFAATAVAQTCLDALATRSRLPVTLPPRPTLYS